VAVPSLASKEICIANLQANRLGKYGFGERLLESKVFGFEGCSGPTIRLPSVLRETADKGTALEDRATTRRHGDARAVPASRNAAQSAIAIDNKETELTGHLILVWRGILTQSDASNQCRRSPASVYQSSGNERAPDLDQLKFNMNG